MVPAQLYYYSVSYKVLSMSEMAPYDTNLYTSLQFVYERDGSVQVQLKKSAPWAVARGAMC